MRPGIQNGFFIALVVLVTVAFVWLLGDFLQVLFWAAALAIVFAPMHVRVAARLGGRRQSLAALLSVLAIVLVVLLPLSGVGVAVAGEAVSVYQRIQSGEIDVQQHWAQVRDGLSPLIAPLEARGIDLDQFRDALSAGALGASRFIAQHALSVGQNAVRITVLFFLMLYLLYFFLRDGERLLDRIVFALPLGDARERHLLARFAEVSRATIKGTLVVGAVQGTIGGITFALLGIGAPVLWGVMMGFLSLLPAVGPALIWVPAAVVLIATGEIVAGIVLIVVGTLVIGLVDNVLRPMLVGRDTRMPDYLILLSTLGGLTLFGLSGIVIGPIIAALFLSVWEMFGHEFGDAAQDADQDTAVAVERPDE